VALLLVCMGFLIHSAVVLRWYTRMIAGYVAVRSSSRLPRV
jgi:hypothetical protein